jgi:hypothetical protein
MDAVAAISGIPRGRPSKEMTAQLELLARRQEAGLFASAVRTVVRQLEGVLLSPAADVPLEAFALTAQLRAMGDRYQRRWEPES